MIVFRNIRIVNNYYNHDLKGTKPTSSMPPLMTSASGTEIKGKDQVKISLFTF